MAIFKCKMCGGNLEITDGISVCECEYCGTKQTLPKLDDEKKANLYDRAGHFRRNNEFDKAISIYEKILEEDRSDAEAYWSLVLCKYGIEYVEDPVTRKRVPTVNRAQYTSIFADADYKSAIEYADAAQKSVYEAEARTIDDIQKGILEISNKEEPFDVFICYKETDANGRRTPDSVLANDLYHQLTEAGYKVFFARITLEDKLGQEYEPYIFAALNSAKVMVVLGTKPEYFNAVWVKNEWSRYLSLIRNGKNKILIPAYRDMDPYDLPEEFSHLQAQDMSKLGFMQDLIRGIQKLTSNEEKTTTKTESEVVSTVTGNIAPLLDRSFLCIEDGDFDKADELLEQVLNLNPREPKAYIGKLLCMLKLKNEEDLARNELPLWNYPDYNKAVRFAEGGYAEKIKGYNDEINNIVKSNIDNLSKKIDEINQEKNIKLQEEQKILDELNNIKDMIFALEDEISNYQQELKEKIKSLDDKYNLLVSKKKKLLIDLKNVSVFQISQKAQINATIDSIEIELERINSESRDVKRKINNDSHVRECTFKIDHLQIEKYDIEKKVHIIKQAIGSLDKKTELLESEKQKLQNMLTHNE